MTHGDLSRIVDADGHYVEDVAAWARAMGVAPREPATKN